jgi:hypothetical protein
MIALVRLFDLHGALVIVKPETFIKWQRTAIRMFWDDLSLKLGIWVSPRTVRKYLNSFRPCGGTSNQRWSIFVWNHSWRSIIPIDSSFTTAMGFSPWLSTRP